MHTITPVAALTIALATTAAAAQTTDRPAPSPPCSIRSTGMNFRPYSALDQSPNTTTGVIEVVCPASGQLAAVRISVSPGRSGRHHDRTLTRSSERLHYNVYTDPGHRRVAGDGSSGTVAPVRLVRGAGRATFRLYGRILPRQTVRAGEYDDTLRVTVEF